MNFSRNISVLTGMTGLILSCLFWAGNYVLCKAMVSDTTATAEAIIFWRFLLGTLLMLAIALPTVGWRAVFAIPRREIPAICGQCLCGMGMTGVFALIAEQHTSAINVTMLEALIPVFILLGGPLIGVSIRKFQLIGVGLGLLGCLAVLKVLTPSGLQLSVIGPGDLFVVLAAGSWATFVLWGRGTQQRVNSSAYTIWGMAATAAGLSFYAAATGTSLAYPLDRQSMWFMALLVLLPTTGAYFCWNEACRKLPLPLLNIVQYLIPVSAVTMAHFILGEAMDTLQILGMALIGGGILLDPKIRAALLRRRK